MTTTALIAHPAAEAFPLLDGDEFVALRDDIAANGLRLPLVLTPDGLLLDGRNRLRACNELGLEPETTIHDGDPVAYVVSINIARRHMNESQRALVAARLATMTEGRPKTAQICAVSQSDAAGMLNIGRRSVQNAAAVLRGVEAGDIPAEAVQDIERGRATVSGVLAAHRPAEPLPFVPEPATNGSHNTDDNWYDEPLTPYEERVAAAYVTPAQQIVEPASPDAPDYDGNEWYTPTEWVDAARAFLRRIDLDPASCEAAQAVVQAGDFYTKERDGLALPWFGNVWMNPPYSFPEVQQFTAKAIDEYDAGNVDQVLILVNNCTDAGWFIRLAERFPVVFSRGRASFWYPGRPSFATRQGQALFYLGLPDRVTDFYLAFSELAYAPNYSR